MTICKECVLALNAQGKVARNEQIKDPIDAVRRYPAPHDCAEPFGDFISADGLAGLGEDFEDMRAHLRPLLAISG